uniref:Rho-GAP domain-containing protein n=1 Tax=Glossina pallidipes TaxID=7398 RepID=A0A1A9ZKB9_GLOPL
MSSWAERVHRRAADFGSVVTSCGHPGSSTPAYPYRLEKVKFGIPLEEVCKNGNIPGPLLVLILKLNKESPNRRDVFRAPGHQGAMKKLIHFLQAGRLVNVDNYSVYTIASVLKKFLRKIPNGVFGRTGENELFAIIELESETEQTERLHKLVEIDTGFRLIDISSDDSDELVVEKVASVFSTHPLTAFYVYGQIDQRSFRVALLCAYLRQTYHDANGATAADDLLCLCSDIHRENQIHAL